MCLFSVSFFFVSSPSVLGDIVVSRGSGDEFFLLASSCFYLVLINIPGISSRWKSHYQESTVIDPAR